MVCVSVWGDVGGGPTKSIDNCICAYVYEWDVSLDVAVGGEVWLWASQKQSVCLCAKELNCGKRWCPQVEHDLISCKCSRPWWKDRIKIELVWYGLCWFGGHVAKRLLGMNGFSGEADWGGPAGYAGRKVWWGHKHTSIYKSSTVVTGYGPFTRGESYDLTVHLRNIPSEINPSLWKPHSCFHVKIIESSQGYETNSP